MNKSTAIALLIIPVSVVISITELQAFSKGLLKVKPAKQGYLISVINNTRGFLTCTLTASDKKERVHVRAGKTSAKYLFNSVPKLRCV